MDDRAVSSATAVQMAVGWISARWGDVMRGCCGAVGWSVARWGDAVG